MLQISASMTQVIPLRTSEPSSSDSEDILAEVAHFEQGGRVLNDHYTSREYSQRRLGHISRHPNYGNTLNIHLKVRRESDEVFGQHSHQRLSVQNVRKSELACHIEPLTPFSTTCNTQTIDDFASYGPTEWEPGMPERWQDLGKSSPTTDSREICPVPHQGSASERKDRLVRVDQEHHKANVTRDCLQLKDGPGSQDAVSTSASMTDKAPSSAFAEPPRTVSTQFEKPNVLSAAPQHRASGHQLPPAFTTASSLYNRPLRSPVKNYRRSQRLSANPVPSNGSSPSSLRKVDCLPSVLKLPYRKSNHNEKVKKDTKPKLPQSNALVDSGQCEPVTEKHVTFCIARAGSPLDHEGSRKASLSKPLRPPTDERAVLPAYSERTRLKSLEKALQWTRSRSKSETQGKIQAMAIVSPNIAPQSIIEHSREQVSSAIVPTQDGNAMVEQQRSLLQVPTETTTASDDSKATARKKYIDEIATGVRLPRNRNDAIAASRRRHEQLFSQHSDQTRRSTQRACRSSEAHPRHPDMLPEFFSPANFQVRDLKPTGTVRCGCGATTDDPSRFPAAADAIVWIQCETPSCGVWQHVDCMGAAVPRIVQSVPPSRPTRRTTRHAADAHVADDHAATMTSTRQLNSEVKYFCHVCDPWAHRHLLAEMRKARPIVSGKESGS